MNNQSTHKTTKIQQVSKHLFVRLVAAQIVIFGFGALVSVLTGLAYWGILVGIGIVVMIVLMPFNFELQSYHHTSTIMMHHAHHQSLQQMGDQHGSWWANFVPYLLGVIPIVAGTVISLM